MSLDVYVAFCRRSRPENTQHWILILAKPGEERCTWYHVQGGPQVVLPTGYRLEIQGNKRLYSQGIEKRTKVATIPESETAKVKAAVQAVPLQRCQTHTVAVLARLENKGLVPVGTSASFNNLVETQKPSGSKSGSSGSSGTKSSGTRPTGTGTSGTRGGSSSTRT